MAKITINGEVFDFDFAHRAMSEAFALEHALGMRYGYWESGLDAGWMKTRSGLVWGSGGGEGWQVEVGEMLGGEVEIDLGGLLDSLQALAAEAQEPDPTDPGGTRPDRTQATGRNTSPSSRSHSASGRGRSGS